MAFLPNNQDQQQQQNQQQGQIPTVPQIPTFQGTSGPSAGQGAGTGTTNTAASPGAAPSTPWQNITTYLTANAPQAGQVADKIAGNLGNQYNQANQGIQQANQNFSQQIESARVPYQADLAGQAAQSPSQFVKDPNNLASFQKMWNANYGGPQDFSHTQDFSNLQGQVLAAQKQAALVNQGAPGLMTLLQDVESQGGRNPTQGVTALDSLLMQGSPNNFGKLSQAAAPFAGLTDYLGQTQTGLDTAAQKAAQEAAATQQTVQNQFTGPGGVAPKMQDTFNKQLQDKSAEAQRYNNEISDVQSRLANGQQLTQQELYDVDKSGGLSAFMGTFLNTLQFPGMSPGYLGQFYSLPPNGGQVAMPTLGNAITPEQFADAQALNQLLGQNAVGTPVGVTPWSAPTDKGSFNDTGAIQGMLSNLQGMESYLPYMTPTQQNDWATDIKSLQGLLGAGAIAPIDAPLPPSPTLSGGIVDPNTGQTTYTPPPSGSTQTGGGRAFR